MNGLASARRFTVPTGVISTSIEHLRAAGRMGCEGLALWAGVIGDGTVEVRQCIVPQQKAYRGENGVCVMIDGDELFRVNAALYKHGLALVAQIHSHPGEAYHSDTDDAYAIATAAGALSMVVPNFATDPIDTEMWATYRLSLGGEWLHVPTSSVLTEVG